VNIGLLRQIQAAGGAYVPLESLGEIPDLASREIDELASFGFLIERHPYFGVAYRGPAERLCPDQIEWELGTRRIGRRIAVWERVSSTNDLARRASSSAYNEGLVILAEQQTAGRGRRGRSWTVPPFSSILMSVLIDPTSELDDPTWLTALGATAVAEVIEARTGLAARVKWPNDVRVGGKKVAGVLVERGTGAVIGIGLNVNFDPAALPDPVCNRATTLSELCGKRLDRSELARELICRLDDLYETGLRSGKGALNDAWRGRLECLGRLVRIETAASRFEGVLADADLTRGLEVDSGGSGKVGRVACYEVLELREIDSIDQI
jgi:BirA family transcriptional regulator, biotin operon repressor / biotin---[acetyl-CoA-carboxylase] ligase